MRLNRRLMLFFGLLVALPLVTVGLVAYMRFSSYTEKITIDNTREMIRGSLNELDMNKIGNEKIADQLLMNRMVRSALATTEQGGDKYAQYVDKEQLRLLIASMIDSFNVRGIVIKGVNGQTIDSGVERPVTLDDFGNVAQAATIRESQGENVWVVMDKDVLAYSPALHIPSLYMIRTMFDVDHVRNKLGYSIVQIDYGRLQSILKKSVPGQGGFALLTDRDGNVLCTTQDTGASVGARLDPDIANRADEPGGGQFRHTADREDYLVLHEKSALSGWSVIEFIPYRNITGKSAEIRNFAFLLTFVCMAAAALIAVPLARHITRPIVALHKMMKGFGRGDLEIRATVNRSDEIGNLQMGFNVMADEIAKLMEQIKEEHRLRGKLELSVLQYQINPHFLFNTLESINWMAHRSGNREIGEMITALARFFRIGLSRGNEFITIREELEHVRHYLLISQIRYRDSFNYRLHSDPAIESYMTLKVILQPIVENAIKYGLRKNEPGGLIDIDGRLTPDGIVLTVTDNGRGMPPGTLAQLRSMLESGEPPGEFKSGVGLLNIHKRIQIAYGEAYGVAVDSVPDRGTSVRVTIPAAAETRINEPFQ